MNKWNDNEREILKYFIIITFIITFSIVAFVLFHDVVPNYIIIMIIIGMAIFTYFFFKTAYQPISEEYANINLNNNKSQIYISNPNNKIFKKILKKENNKQHFLANPYVHLFLIVPVIAIVYVYSTELIYDAKDGVSLTFALYFGYFLYQYGISTIGSFNNVDIINQFYNSILIKNDNDIFIYKLDNNANVKPNLKSTTALLLGGALNDSALGTALGAYGLTELSKSLTDSVNNSNEMSPDRIKLIIDEITNNANFSDPDKYMDCKLIKETKKYYLVEGTEIFNETQKKGKFKIYKVYVPLNNYNQEVNKDVTNN